MTPAAARRHARVREVEPRRVAGGLRLEEARMPVRRKIRIAAEAREHARCALLHGREPGARDVEVVARLVERVLAAHAALLQLALAVELPGGEVDPLLGLLGLGERDPILRAQGREIGAHDRHLRVGFGDRHFERRGIDPEQQCAGRDRLVVAHPHLDHAPGDLGADGDDVRLDVGVVGLDVAPAGGIEVERCQPGDDRHADEKDGAKPLPPDARPRCARLSHCGDSGARPSRRRPPAS